MVVPSSAQHARLVLLRRAYVLAYIGLLWHFAEAAVALAAGIAADSMTMVAFGADSLVEVLAGMLLIWRFTGSRRTSASVERMATRLMAIGFVVIAVYVALDIALVAASAHVVVGDLGEGTAAADLAHTAGIVLAVITIVTMYPLAWAKLRVARQMHSGSAEAEGKQTLLCAHLSLALLAGVVGSSVGMQWLDVAMAAVIGAVALREARVSWKGGGCSCHGTLAAPLADGDPDPLWWTADLGRGRAWVVRWHPLLLAAAVGGYVLAATAAITVDSSGAQSLGGVLLLAIAALAVVGADGRRLRRRVERAHGLGGAAGVLPAAAGHCAHEH